MLVAFLMLLLMPAVELRTTSASAAARAEHNAAQAASAASAAPDDESGAHRAPVETEVGEAPEDEPEGRHVAATPVEEVPDPR